MGDEGLVLSFQYVIQEICPHTVYFAFCYPYAYIDCQRKLNSLDQKYGSGNKQLYYHRYSKSLCMLNGIVHVHVHVYKCIHVHVCIYILVYVHTCITMCM